MSSSLIYEFIFKDSLSLDDSDLDELVNNDDGKHMILVLASKQLGRANLKRRRLEPF
jgi:hypothetical protein